MISGIVFFVLKSYSWKDQSLVFLYIYIVSFGFDHDSENLKLKILIPCSGFFSLGCLLCH